MSDGQPTRQELHQVVRMAQADLRANPNNVEAQQALAGALDGIRQWATGTGEGTASDENRAAAQQEMLASQPGAGTALAAGFADMGGMGTADELAGLGRQARTPVFEGPGGRRPSHAYAAGRDEYRATDQAAEAFHPWVYGAGQVAGLLPGMIGTAARGIGGAAARLPAVAEDVSTTLANRTAALAARTQAARRAAVAGGALGGIGGYFHGEQGPLADLAQVPLPMMGGAAIGALMASVGNARMRMREQGAANEQGAAARAASSGAVAERQPLLTDLAQSRLGEQDAIAANRRLQGQAIENTLAEAPERQAARRAGWTRAERAAQRAEETHARRTATAPEPGLETAGRAARERISVLRLEELERRAAQSGGQAARRGGDAEAGARAYLERQGTPPEAVERSIERMRSQGLFGARPTETPAPEVQEVARATPPEGPPAPGSVDPATGRRVPRPTMPGSPQEAARAAYHQVEAAGAGDPRVAARRAAAVASDAVPVPPAIPIPGEGVIPLRAHEIVSGRPTQAARRELLDLLSGLAPDVRLAIQRQLPTPWVRFLTSGR